MATIKDRLIQLERAHDAQEYPWLFVHGKPTTEQQARINKATRARQLLCFWEDRVDVAWLAGSGKPPPWEKQEGGEYGKQP